MICHIQTCYYQDPFSLDLQRPEFEINRFSKQNKTALSIYNWSSPVESAYTYVGWALGKMDFCSN